MIDNPKEVAACLMSVLAGKGINHEYIFPNATFAADGELQFLHMFQYQLV
jgi:hypothetical protein